MDDGAALYSIGAIARMTGVSVVDAAHVGGSLRAGRREPKRRRPAPLQPPPARAAACSSPARSGGDAARRRAPPARRPGVRVGHAGAAGEPLSDRSLPILIADRDPYRRQLRRLLPSHRGLPRRGRVGRRRGRGAARRARARARVLELLLSGGLGGSLIASLKQTDALVVAGLAAGRGRGRLRARRARVPAEADRSRRPALDRTRPARHERPDGHTARRRLVIARLASGIARLDAILAGGLAEDSINLIIGVPGSGKTILAQRYAFHNGTRRAAGALHLDGFGAARQDRPLRTDALVLRRRRGRESRPLRGCRQRARRRAASRRSSTRIEALLLERHPGRGGDRQLQGAHAVRRRRTRLPAVPARARGLPHGGGRLDLLARGVRAETRSRRRPSSRSPTA